MALSSIRIFQATEEWQASLTTSQSTIPVLMFFNVKVAHKLHLKKVVLEVDRIIYGLL